MLNLKRYKPRKGPRKGAETFDELLRRKTALPDGSRSEDDDGASTGKDGGEA